MQSSNFKNVLFLSIFWLSIMATSPRSDARSTHKLYLEREQSHFGLNEQMHHTAYHDRENLNHNMSDLTPLLMKRPQLRQERKMQRTLNSEISQVLPNGDICQDTCEDDWDKCAIDNCDDFCKTDTCDQVVDTCTECDFGDDD